MKNIFTLLICLVTISVNGQFINYNLNNSPISGKLAWFVVRDNNGVVYTATSNGLSRYDAVTNSWTVYKTSNSNIPSNDIHGLAFDGANNLWIATYSGGLCKFDGTTFTTFNTSNSTIPTNQLYHITYNAPTNSLWIGTRYGGLSKLNLTTLQFTNYGFSNGLTDNVIDDVDIDAQGNVWIACRYNGVAKYDGTSFTYYTTTDGLAGNDIYSISVAPDGKIWAGCTTGLSVFDGTYWTNYNTSNSSLSGNYIRQIEFANTDIWIGSGGGGLQRFDGATTWTTYRTSNSNIANDSIWSVFIDPTQTVWAASYGRGLLEMPAVTVQDDSTHARIAHFPPVSPIITYDSKINTNPNLFVQTVFTSTLQINAPSHNKFEVFDVSGKQVFSDYINSNFIDLSKLEIGIYIAVLTDANQKIRTQKILKID